MPPLAWNKLYLSPCGIGLKKEFLEVTEDLLVSAALVKRTMDLGLMLSEGGVGYVIKYVMQETICVTFDYYYLTQ